MTKMIWSIVDKNEPDFIIPIRKAFYWENTEEVKYLEDGEYTVSFGDHNTILSVKGGEWEEGAESKIEEIVEKDGYWGVFIEGFEMNSDNVLNVVIGS